MQTMLGIAITALTGGMVSFAVWVVNSIFDLRRTDALQEFKMEQIWGTIKMNATLKIARDNNDLGSFNSPLIIHDEARRLYDRYGFTSELHQFWLDHGRHLKAMDFELELARRFRERFASTVCKDRGWTDGECLVLAAKIAQEAKERKAAEVDSDDSGDFHDTKLEK